MGSDQPYKVQLTTTGDSSLRPKVGLTPASVSTEKLRDRTESTFSKVAGDTQLGWSMQATP